MTELIRRHKGILGMFLLLSPFLWVGASGIREHLMAGTDETYQELRVFSDVLDIIENNYVDPVDSKELIHGAIQGMISSIDPHSAFLLPEAYKELQIETKGEFSGLGIVITMHNNVVTVVSPIEGSPAYEAGVKAGDQVIKVDDESTKNMLLWEAVKKMRGKKGTSVVITVVRKGASEPIDFTIVRDIIPLESVRSFVLRPGFGYIRVTNFREDTVDDMEEALKSLNQEDGPLKGLILDLRDNPGGLLDQSIKAADLFLDEGDIVSIKGRVEKHSKVYRAHPNGGGNDYPIVLLINEGSASASEIVAGALQDHGRALVLGKTSFGKGSVQTVEPLRDGSGLKLTIARYYTPNGNAIQAKGIIPDVIVEQRDLSEDEDERRRHLKEKDLENHLSAMPGEEMTDEIREKMLDRRGIKIPDEDDSDLDPAEMILSKDYQVRRALDILTSWQIFSKMANKGKTP